MGRGVSSGWRRACAVAGVSGWLLETWVLAHRDTREGCAMEGPPATAAAQVDRHTAASPMAPARPLPARRGTAATRVDVGEN